MSKLFSWYKNDFDSRGGVERFIEGYNPETMDKKSDFLDYNWFLNKLKMRD